MRLLRPIYRSDELASKLLKHLKINYAKPAYQGKAKVVAASFLYAAKRIQESNATSADKIALGWPHKDSHWTKYPAVGQTIIKEIREALIHAALIQKIPDTGQVIFDENGKIAERLTTLYTISPSLYDDFDPSKATYSDQHRVAVKVAKHENYGQKKERKAAKRSSPKLTIKECKNTFKGEWSKVNKRIKILNEYYAKHPLILDDGFKCSAVTRVFSDGRLDAGGRMYAAYSDLASTERLKATINGNPVCEIDIRASQPTLLSCLLGYKLGDTWDDIYSTLPSVMAAKNPDEKEAIRDQVKSVITELMGAGNAGKNDPSNDLKAKGVDKFLFLSYRDEAVEAIPALSEMKAKDISSNGYTTFHESEIILGAIETLMRADIAAYSVHDSIIVESSVSVEAVEALRTSWASHCKNNQQTNKNFTTYPALKVTHHNKREQMWSGHYSGF